MEKKKTGLKEQNAPGKNTDKAYVKVNRDGSPQIPDKNKQPDKNSGKSPRK